MLRVDILAGSLGLGSSYGSFIRLVVPAVVGRADGVSRKGSRTLGGVQSLRAPNL